MYTFHYGSTLDPKKFEKLTDYNRGTKTPQVEKLKKSVKDINLLPANPIIVANGFILDGQHRYDVCVAEKLPIHYVEIKNMSIEDMLTAMHKLNSNAKNWGLQDYLKLYIRQGMKNYQLIEDFKKDYDLSISQSVYALRDFDDRVYKDTSLAGFKEGLFEPINEEIAVNKARMYKSFKETVETNSKNDVKIVRQGAFIKAFFKLVVYQNVDLELLKDNLRSDLKSDTKTFVKSDSVSAYHDILVKIYNSKCKNELKLKNWEEMKFDEEEVLEDIDDSNI